MSDLEIRRSLAAGHGFLDVYVSLREVINARIASVTLRKVIFVRLVVATCNHGNRFRWYFLIVEICKSVQNLISQAILLSDEVDGNAPCLQDA